MRHVTFYCTEVFDHATTFADESVKNQKLNIKKTVQVRVEQLIE